MTVIGYIEFWDPLLPNDAGPRPLNQVETKAVNNLFDWTSAVVLPGSEFSSDYDETADFSNGKLARNTRKSIFFNVQNRYHPSPDRESV